MDERTKVNFNGEPLVFCHGDLQAGNFIVKDDNGKLFLVGFGASCFYPKCYAEVTSRFRMMRTRIFGSRSSSYRDMAAAWMVNGQGYKICDKDGEIFDY